MYRNLPNALSLLRLILTPFVARAIWTGEFRQAAALVFIAGITDALDGYLARRFHWTSRAGAYLDPVADKLLLVSSYFALGMQGAVPIWLVWLVLGRDAVILAMVGIGFVFTNVRNFPPTVWGKLSTIVQVFTALAVVLDRAFSPDPHLRLESVPIYVTAVITTLSGIHYLWVGLQSLRAARSPQLLP